jgi:hypothetical protein
MTGNQKENAPKIRVSDRYGHMDLPILSKSLNFDIVFTVIAESKMFIDRASNIVSTRSNLNSTSEPQQQ